MAQRSLDWLIPAECLNGETTDISFFRFPWFCPIWYYVPSKKLPRYKMKPGWMLGPSPNVGNARTYMIYPNSDLKKSRGRVKHIHRSVVRVRD